jgi:hypothetical protein
VITWQRRGVWLKCTVGRKEMEGLGMSHHELENESGRFAARGLIVLSEVMKEQGLLKRGDNVRNNELFQKVISL